MSKEVQQLIEDVHSFVANTKIEYVCDTCNSILTTTRWKCRSCPAFDECEACHDDKLKNHNKEMFFKDKTIHEVVLLHYSEETKRWFSKSGKSTTHVKPKRGRPPKTKEPSSCCACEVILKDRDEEYRILKEGFETDLNEMRKTIEKFQKKTIDMKDHIEFCYENDQKSMIYIKQLKQKIVEQQYHITKLQKRIDYRENPIALVQVLRESENTTPPFENDE
jgi:hypothetical protein